MACSGLTSAGGAAAAWPGVGRWAAWVANPNRRSDSCCFAQAAFCSSVADASALQQTLADADAALVILIAVHDLKASALVTALADACATMSCRRVLFTAGEITAMPAPGERQTLRQRGMLALFAPLMALTPYSLRDMRDASRQIRELDWDWTIIRAPTLIDASPAGYRLGALDAVRGAARLSRADYAACLIDAVAETGHYRRLLTVLPTDSHEFARPDRAAAQ